MSWKESIVWTALPNGMKNGKLRLTVMVAPRLQASPPPGKTMPELQQFPHFLHWPETLGGLKLTVNTSSSAGLAVLPPKQLEASPDPDSPAVDPNLWKKLFKSSTAVEAFVFKRLDDRLIHSFPALNVHSYLKQRYVGLAVSSPIRLPSIETLASHELGFGQLTNPLISGVPMGYNELKQEVLQREQLGALAGQAGLKQQAGMRQQAGIAQQVGAKTQPGVQGQAGVAGQKAAGQEGADQQQYQTRSYDRDAKQQGVDPQRLLHEDIKLRTRTHLLPLFGSAKAIPVGPPNPVNDFMQVKHFHLPLSTKRLPLQIEKPQIDFHRMLTSLGSHPELLRRLGLAIDLLVTVPAGGLPANGRIWIEVTWPAPQPNPLPDAAPRTEFIYQATAHPALAFQARPSTTGNDLDSRMLRLGSNEFGVLQVDTDGAAEKTMLLAANLVRARSPELRSADSPEDTSMPSMQSAGIAVARTGRAVRMAGHFATAKSNDEKLTDPTQQVVLWAEDLVRGYRVDILDATTGAWQSLCRRAVSYDLLDGSQPITVADEESWISASVTSSTDENEPGGKDLYLHEALFRWAGWSLAVHRPGKMLADDCTAGEFANLPESGFPLRVSTSLVKGKGTLPRLRFGRGYRVRARAVDLAGNSLTLDDANAVAKPPLLDVVATDKGFAYRRYEPLQQPIVVLRRDLTGSPGENVERLVIRSYNDAPAKDSMVSPESTERHFAPAAVAQLTAELHGMFDGPSGMRSDMYSTIVDNEGSFSAHGSSAPRIYPEEQLQLPYLPDPLARGAAFLGLPQKSAPDNKVLVQHAGGAAETWAIMPPQSPAISVRQVEFGGAGWPDLLPFRVRVEGTIQRRDPEWDAARRVLTVYLVPAEIARVKLSTYLAKEDLERLALWEWIRESGKGPDLERRVLAGLHWMLTPSRELTFVHAVQQPLVTPEFKSLASNRNVGDNFTILSDAVPVDGRSTSKVDVLADWDEPRDDGPAPVRVAGRAHAFEVKLDYGDTVAAFGPDRIISFLPITLATQQMAKVAAADAAPPAAPATAPAAAPAVRSVAAPQAATQQRVRAVSEATVHPGLLAAPSFAREVAARSYVVGRHEFGDTRYRRVNYTASAVTRFREYLPFSDTDIEQVRAKSITRRSQPKPIDVLSTARPAAPRIVYVVPTFGWERKSAGGTMTSRRSGGGLRIYLERPWFSSGDGELLGVIIGQPLRPARPTVMVPPLFPESLKPYFTQWGLDPIWAAEPTPVALAPELGNFRNPAATETDLTLDELEGARVSVAGYPVGTWDADGTLHGYDPERGLWFCDVELDPGNAYFPFVRLALARYQPHSLRWSNGDVKLSRVVVADFAQLTPDRAVSVTQASETELNVVVSGVTYREGAADKYGGGLSAAAGALQSAGTSDAPQDATKGTTQMASKPTTQMASKATTQAPTLRREVGAAKVPLLPAAQGGSSVEVSVETRPAGGNELAWVVVPDSTVVLQGGSQLGASRTWSGKVTLPAPRGSKPFRLVIRENELFCTDYPDQPMISHNFRPVAHRLVFAETLEV